VKGPIYWQGGVEQRLLAAPQPLDLDTLLAPGGPWELEVGYGKGRYLLGQALAHPERRYVGIEVVAKYYKRMVERAGSRGVRNLLNVRGEALAILATLLPRGFADRVHVYFPDPWPKIRHRRRRLFDPETVDLVLGAVKPGGELQFATDFLEYGELVVELLSTHPHLDVQRHEGPWPDGARTNYETKFLEEGRPILRLVARKSPDSPIAPLHPQGAHQILAAYTPARDDR
jgi:tRNA (guanine-N7-)-methyltransferase